MARLRAGEDPEWGGAPVWVCAGPAVGDVRWDSDPKV